MCGDRQYGQAIRACHIAPLARNYVGGPAVSVPSLCAALIEQGIEVQLLCLDLDTQLSQGVPVANFGRWEVWPLKELSISPRLRRATAEWAKRVDVLHCHGMWQMPTIYPAWAVVQTGSRLIVSPRGSLSPAALRHSRLKKQLVWWLLQRRVFERAHCIHVTSEAEARDVRGVGVTKPIAVVPNGVAVGVGLAASQRGGTRGKQVLYLGRLHPIKGLEMLLHSWGLLEKRVRDAELVIAGDGEPRYRECLASLGRRIGLRNVSYTGKVSDVERPELLGRATVLVLPSLSENFGMVVAEALAAGVPVVASKGTPWEGVVEHGCGWWLDGEPELWANALETVLSLTRGELREMGGRGRAWMSEEYSWPGVAGRMAATYSWLLGRADRPGWVRQA